ncbi:MAG: IS3 family transposase [Sedimenticola sp.]
MGKRKAYSDEFKREAVLLSNRSGVTQKQISKELGITPGTLARWRNEYAEYGDRAFSGQGNPRDEEIASLKRELARVKKERGFFKRSGSVLRQGIVMKYRMIDRCRETYPIKMMCRQLGVSTSGYYDWRNREPSKRDRSNERLLSHIQAIHADSDGTMGAPRIWEELRYQGFTCSKNRVARLMKANKLQGIPQKRRWKRKASEQRPGDISNHLERDFSAETPNTKWVTDITYIRTAENWLYLCVVIDLFSGIVVGWSMSHRQTRELVIQAVLMALWQRDDLEPVVLHSDRGCQFASDEYQQFLKGHNLICSMSDVGSCADNAAVEGFFGLLKRERVHRRQYLTRAEARTDIFDYIERFHNPRRRRKMEHLYKDQNTLTKQSVKTG